MRFVVVMVCFIIGFCFAYMIQLLSANSIIVPDLIYNTITLRAIQFVLILGWTIFGVVMSAFG